MQALLEEHFEPKSLCIAYFLLIVGGIFGLHHLYLGDARLARLYFMSLGMCGVGVALDFCRLPALVEEANVMMQRSERGVLYSSSACSSYPFCEFVK